MRISSFIFFVLGIAVLALPGLALAQYEFTPLTNLPGLDQAAGSDSLPTFFNNLYRLCIGAAAVIAVLQIMRAGAYFMFNKGSVAHNEKAKGLIMNSVLGLLLVLSPVIVFNIINPDILDLRLDVERIKPQNQSGITSGDITDRERNQCSVYTQLQPLADPDGTNQCPDGKEKISASCCNITSRTQMCCGAVASTQYLLAYHFDRYRKTESGGRGELICRMDAVAYYANEADCTAVRTTAASPRTPPESEVWSASTFVKSCESVRDRSFSMPTAPAGVRKCDDPG